MNQQLYLFIYFNLFITGGIFTYMQAVTVNCEIAHRFRTSVHTPFFISCEDNSVYMSVSVDGLASGGSLGFP